MKIPEVSLPPAPLRIESLDQEGRGIARRDGKTIFVEGALPGELVTASVYRKKPSFEIAYTDTVLKASSARVTPRCAYFGRCGGCACSTSICPPRSPRSSACSRTRLWHIGKVKPEEMLAPIHGPAWGYRHRARFTARYVPKKGGALVGFHEKRSSYVADMASCEVVPGAHLGAARPPAPHAGATVDPPAPAADRARRRRRADVLVLRVLDPPSAEDEALLRSFGERHGVYLYLQPGGPDTARPFHPPQAPICTMCCPNSTCGSISSPTDFTQVNHAVNRVLVRRALKLLAPQPGERIADMFCGLGNFSLPIARSGAQVVGIEGSAALIARARNNAARNGLAENSRFEAMDLFKIDAAKLAALGRFDGMLIDPPRDGAVELVKGAGGGRAAAHRLCLLQPGNARPRRRGAGARQRLPAQGRGRRQHVPAHGARRIDRCFRARRERTSDAVTTKKAPRKGALFPVLETVLSRARPRRPSGAAAGWRRC